jgi:hypothetical protein
MMQTRSSSPPQAPDAPPQPESSGKAHWSEDDEIALIEYIADHKAEAGDGMKFKGAFWTGAAKEMQAHSSLGGPKTPAGCSSKWDRVCMYLFQAICLLMRICPAQEVVQRCCYS